MSTLLHSISSQKPVLIAGPTASGKSALALAIAEQQGGVVVNADASQIYDCWRIVTARPDAEEEARAPHALYGHVAFDQPYSAGHWQRDVARLLADGARPIIVGGTGLYFTALTEGLTRIPETPAALRTQADAIPLAMLISELDVETAQSIDLNNRARVQRAWEVLKATGRGLKSWQGDTDPPLLALDEVEAFVIDAPKEDLTPRIAARFRQMLNTGAIEEVEAMQDRFDPTLPSCKAIGVPQIMELLAGRWDEEETIEQATIATRQYAKRQRTWFRKRMQQWRWVTREDVTKT